MITTAIYPEALICLIIAVFTALTTLWLQLRPALNVYKNTSRQNKAPLPTSLPPVSVIVYTSCASSKLSSLLELLMTQDYPGEYEVIVVNEGEDPLTDDVLLLAESRWHNLRHTFTPAGTRNLSPRKLALTLGIKAAHYDIIVHTTTDATPDSKKWLAHMAAPFINQKIELAIGVSSVCEPKTTGIRGANRSHYCLFDNTVILNAAINGTAFSGDANNLAYRRDLFFRHNGFSESLDIFYGDDDVFVSVSATKDNVTAVAATDSIVSINGDDTSFYYRNLRLKRAFTADYLKRTPRFMFNLSILTLYIWLIATVATVVFAPLWMWGIVGNVAIALALWTPMYFIWNRMAKALKSRPFYIGLPIFLFTLPLRKLYYRLRCKAVHRAQISWQSTKQTTKR
ncbi:MAG: hypothetical protein K2M98_01380 [Muribaculum sp.]|nr:hypothetical protein [Muribaculum sp.]